MTSKRAHFALPNQSVPDRSTVMERVAAIAAAQPHALALGGLDGDVNYRELVSRAAVMSIRLRDAGALPEDLVALCLPRSADLVIAALGVLMAGGGYVALDADQPEARLRFMVADCTATVVVAPMELGGRVGGGLPVVTPVYESDLCPDQFDGSGPDSVAYAVYTSGSTGVPKGVLNTHAGLLNLIDWHQRAFSITTSDRATLIANPGFDAAAWELWPYLTAGASLHIAPEQIKTDPVRLRDWLIAEGITVCFLPTPLAEAIIAIGWPASVPLRFMLTGGDVLNRRPPADLPFTLVNNYGVAEAAVVSTSMSVSPLTTGPDSAPPVGFPIDGVTLRVIDEQGAPVPAGTDGELLICGPSVALGYLGHPELTAEKFIVDPLDPGVRAYRTGDRVRFDAAGAVEFLERLDGQVQIRGVRVETAEIVSVTNSHPAIASSAVASVDSANGTFLVLGIVADAGRRVSDEEVRAYLAHPLPHQLLPSWIVCVPALPTTANGKIDRAALAALATPQSVDDQQGPRNEVESALAGTVAELLKVPRVAVDANFFLLGGHSMLGAQLIVRVAEVYGVEMSLLTLFDNPTVAQMAAEIERSLIDEIEAMSDDDLRQASATLSASSVVLR